MVARQNAIAANLANATTPGYKQVEVKFEKNLRDLMGTGFAMRETNPGHMPTRGKGLYGLKESYTVSLSQEKLDGNSVDLEDQFGKSAANSLNYATLTTAFNKKLDSIFSAIKGGGK